METSNANEIMKNMDYEMNKLGFIKEIKSVR